MVSPPRKLKVAAFNQPVSVVALAKFIERFGQLVQCVEAPYPDVLFLASTEDAFDRAVAFRFAGEGR